MSTPSPLAPHPFAAVRSCAADIQKFCFNDELNKLVDSGEAGPLLRCIQSHYKELDAACKQGAVSQLQQVSHGDGYAQRG